MHRRAEAFEGAGILNVRYAEALLDRLQLPPLPCAAPAQQGTDQAAEHGAHEH